MRPQIENIEARSAETIFQALRDRIPRYLREWDDYNESDPGIALLQLFAVVGEGLSHQLSRLPGALQAELPSLAGDRKRVREGESVSERLTRGERHSSRKKQHYY